MIDALLQDIRYSWRTMSRSPGLTAAALATLALGIGANTAVFTLLNAALFRDVAAPEPDRLVWLSTTRGGRNGNMSYPEYLAYRDGIPALSGLLAYQDIPLALAGGGEPRQITGLIVTGNYFDVLSLGTTMAAGRAFRAEEDRPGATPVAVLSDVLYRNQFGADPSIVGRTVTLNGAAFTVVGIAPAGFRGIEMGSPADVWVTMAAQPFAMPGHADFMTSAGIGWLRSVGRLKAGGTLVEADAAARTVAARLASLLPDSLKSKTASVTPLSGGLDPANRQEAQPILLLLMTIPMLVLLIACANVANLLLSRAAVRAHEIGVRRALGANRSRLVRQLVTESLVLGILGGILALITSPWISRGVLVLAAAPEEVFAGIGGMDGRVLGFTFLVSLMSGIAFGIAPALGATGLGVVNALKGTTGAGGTARRSRLMGGIVSAQVAVSLVLLVLSGLFVRSLGKALAVDPGFDTAHEATVSYDLGLMGYSAERADVLHRELLARAATLPGVTAVSLATEVPLSGRMRGAHMTREDASADDGGRTVFFSTIRPRFFETIGLPLRKGRDFTDNDAPGSTFVAIVNETLARRFWPDEDPIGKRLRIVGDPALREVVGVAADAKYDELTEDVRPFAYVPQRQETEVGPIVLVARTEGDPASLLPTLAQTVRSLDANLPLVKLRTMKQMVAERVDKQRAAAALVTAFGGLALILASLGLYGVMAYNVAQRAREIGIRVALGAQRADILRLFVREGLRRTAAGIAFGLLLSGLLASAISSFLYGVTVADLPSFGAAIAVLASVAVAASLVPARRAATASPMSALRHE